MNATLDSMMIGGRTHYNVGLQVVLEVNGNVRTVRDGNSNNAHDVIPTIYLSIYLVYYKRMRREGR